eukprot:7096478-Prymnesium_polylepis.1
MVSSADFADCTRAARGALFVGPNMLVTFFPFGVALTLPRASSPCVYAAAVPRAPRARCGVAVADEPSVGARLLVLDTVLPGQRLRCDQAPDSFAALVEDCTEPLVLVSRNQLSLHWVGCEATASRDDEGSVVVLTASDRLASVEEAGDDAGSKWNGRAGTVTFFGRLREDDYLLSVDDIYSLTKAYEHGSNLGLNDNPERLSRLGALLTELTEQWLGTMRSSGAEASARVDDVVEQLGPMPEALNAKA